MCTVETAGKNQTEGESPSLLTSTHDTVHRCLLEAAMDVFKVLDVSISKHRNLKLLSAIQRVGIIKHQTSLQYYNNKCDMRIMK